MTTKYHIEIWKRAMHEAESAVVCATATPVGGRKQGEDLMSYVERTRRIQAGAVARWLTAKTELEAAEALVFPRG